MGDCKPSQFLRHLRSLVPDLPDYFLRTIWTSRLPENVQATLACHPEVELDVAANALTASSRRFSRPRSRAVANQQTITSF
jgi:hypothetical protein